MRFSSAHAFDQQTWQDSFFSLNFQVLLNVRDPTKWYDSVKDAIYRYVYVLKIGWISKIFFLLLTIISWLSLTRPDVGGVLFYIISVDIIFSQIQCYKFDFNIRCTFNYFHL